MDFSFHLPGQTSGQNKDTVSLSPLASQPVRRVSVGGPDSITKILIAVNIISLLAVAGLFGWQYYLEQQIAGKKLALATYGGAVSELPLRDIKELSNKLKVVNQLVKEYPFVTNIFPILEESIENRVTYSALELQTLAGEYILTLQAEAPDYKTVVRQMDVLHTDVYKKYFPTVSLETLKPSSKGTINFSLRTAVNLKGVTPDQLVLFTTLSDTNLSPVISDTVSPNLASPSEFELLETAPIP